MKWTEEDVELADRYATVLERIEELGGAAPFTEADIEAAERYARALQRIEEVTAD